MLLKFVRQAQLIDMHASVYHHHHHHRHYQLHRSLTTDSVRSNVVDEVCTTTHRSIHTVTVTSFRSKSMLTGFRRHLAGKNVKLLEMFLTLLLVKYVSSVR